MKKIAIFLLVTGGIWAEIVVKPEFTEIGGTFTVKGSGFGSNEEVLIEGAGMKNIATTSPEGAFFCTFNVSLTPGGEHVVTATSQSRVENSRIWIVPTVKLAPNSGSIGDEIEVTGWGYGCSERIQIGMERMPVVAEAYASDMGTFSTKFNVANHPRGENRLFAIGHGTYLLAKDGFTMKPKVLLNSGSGCVGSGISLSGSGFTPNEEIRIDFGKIETLSTYIVTRDGNFQADFGCPKLSGGEQTILIQGKDFIETMTFCIKPRLISLEPNRGYVGTGINICLDGLTKGEVLTVGFDNNPSYATFTINGDGTFTEGLIVDTRPGGLKVITVTTDSGIFHTSIFKIRPSISFVTPTTPFQGEKIIFNGVGFMDFEKIRVDFGRREGVLWLESNENGTFTGEYIIQDPSGNYRLVTIGYKTSDVAIININVVEKRLEEPVD